MPRVGEGAGNRDIGGSGSRGGNERWEEEL